MAGISFGNRPEYVWIVAGWAFRQALKDLEPYARGNRAFLDKVNAAGHIAFLDVENLGDPLRIEVTRAVEAMCRDVLSREGLSSRETLPDAQTQDMYLEGIRMLQGIVRASLADS